MIPPISMTTDDRRRTLAGDDRAGGGSLGDGEGTTPGGDGGNLTEGTADGAHGSHGFDFYQRWC